MEKKSTLASQATSSETVLNYLRDHPRLLIEHPEVLSEIVIPHSTGAATSLVERQVSALREQIRQLKNQLRDLIEIAKENGKLSEQLHILAGKIIQISSIEDGDQTSEVFLILKKALISDFKADRVIFCLFTERFESGGSDDKFTSRHWLGTDWPQKPLFEEVLANQQPVCGRLSQKQHEALFKDELPEYSSAVLLPLTGKDWTGLLAIGSQDPQRYSDDMGTELLAQMADIFTLAINPYVKPTPSSQK